jgi:hypothetical protein
MYAWVFHVVSIPQVSPPERCMNFSSPPYILHALTISVFLIWSLKKLLVNTHKSIFMKFFNVIDQIREMQNFVFTWSSPNGFSLMYIYML